MIKGSPHRHSNSIFRLALPGNDIRVLTRPETDVLIELTNPIDTLDELAVIRRSEPFHGNDEDEISYRIVEKGTIFGSVQTWYIEGEGGPYEHFIARQQLWAGTTVALGERNTLELSFSYHDGRYSIESRFTKQPTDIQIVPQIMTRDALYHSERQEEEPADEAIEPNDPLPAVIAHHPTAAPAA